MKDNRNEIYAQLESLIEHVIKEFELKENKTEFDVDAVFFKIFQDFNISIEYGILRYLYNLLDQLCDSMAHNNLWISRTYLVEEGIKDLKIILTYIKDNDPDRLENDLELRIRLLKI
ncbi:hypothetical protein BH09BAC3_BH09BAC3_35920 [soil metagenome]